jgi:hypothetical protein
MPKRIEQESLSQWKYEGMELMSRVLTLPKMNGGCMHADSLQEVARYVRHWYPGLKTLGSVVHPIR